MTVQRLGPAGSAHLNVVRALAAVAVVVGHIRGLFFVEFGKSNSHGPIVSLLYAVSGLGHQAVIVFFVLSGYFVAGSAIRRLPSWSWRHYLGNRVTRLYLVLLPALLLTAVLDQLSMRMPLGPQYFEHPIPHFNAPPIAAAISPGIFLENALFLQTVAAPTFGSNLPLWSLANEFWYYLLFPLAVLAVYPGTIVTRLFCAVLAVLMAIVLPSDILAYFPVWLLGAGISILPLPSLGRNVLFVARIGTAVLFFGALLLSRAGRLPDVAGDYCIAAAFSLFMLGLISVPSGPAAPVARSYSALAATLAGFSYSLYATHMPILLLGRSSWTGEPAQPTVLSAAMGLGLAVGVLLCSYLFSRVTEARTDDVRNALFRAFGVVSR